MRLSVRPSRGCAAQRRRSSTSPRWRRRSSAACSRSGCRRSRASDSAARYVAGSADAQVGGDWYDVITLREGHAGITIGDVVGHGLDAAARMARLQNALRAYALEGLRPSLVLERMNGFAREVAGGPMATLLYGVVDSEEGSLRLATAGHPPPLVIGPTGRRLLRRGPGRQPARRCPVSRLTRNRRYRCSPARPCCSTPTAWWSAPRLRSTRGSSGCAALPRGSRTHPDELCGALLQARFRDSAARDDVALLAVRIEPIPVGADRGHAARRARVAGADAPLGRALAARRRRLRPEIYETLVAAGEACANAIAHAYPPGEASYVVEALRSADAIEIRVRDFGSWRAPRSGSRGRGIR